MTDRRLWRAVDALHAVVYFAPEAATVYADIGLRGWFNGYTASRAAALGPVGPAVVTALFHGFAPALVARSLPAAWDVASPQRVLAVRTDLAVLALTRAEVTASSEVVDGLASLLATADFGGRALAAAHAGLPVPTDPLAALWHHCTVLRELRGDGHVAALVTAGLDGCAANVLNLAVGAVPDRMQSVRGWSDEQWAAARESLQERGLLAADGSVTAGGRALRERVEATTDDTVAGVRAPEVLVDRLVELAVRIAGSGAIPYPNPTGVAAP